MLRDASLTKDTISGNLALNAVMSSFLPCHDGRPTTGPSRAVTGDVQAGHRLVRARWPAAGTFAATWRPSRSGYLRPWRAGWRPDRRGHQGLAVVAGTETVSRHHCPAGVRTG